jgi:chromosomal replication initiator protein
VGNRCPGERYAIEAHGSLHRSIFAAPKSLRTITSETIDVLIAECRQPIAISADLILTTVARHFRLKLPELVGPSRRQSLIKARGIAICLLRDLGDMKWQAIADATGRKDHSTVLHAYAKTQRSLVSDPILTDALRQVQQKLLRHSDNGK